MRCNLRDRTARGGPRAAFDFYRYARFAVPMLVEEMSTSTWDSVRAACLPRDVVEPSPPHDGYSVFGVKIETKTPKTTTF